MSYPNVVANPKLVHPGYQIQVADCDVVINLAVAGVDYAQPYSDAFANPVTKKKPIEHPL
jgi:hypothetical protein